MLHFLIFVAIMNSAIIKRYIGGYYEQKILLSVYRG